jgi:hypothetical protein
VLAVGAAGAEPEVAFYGLVAQSTTLPGLPRGLGTSALSSCVDGCYVLKTERNKDVSGCTCTVFTLTRVCQGQPLYQQLRESWLATPNLA